MIKKKTSNRIGAGLLAGLCAVSMLTAEMVNFQTMAGGEPPLPSVSQCACGAKVDLFYRGALKFGCG